MTTQKYDKRIIPLIDQTQITQSKVEKLDIQNYCNFSNQKWKINFVGFVVQRESIIVSFPKNYFEESDLLNISQVELVEHVDILIEYFSIETRDLDSLYGGSNPVNSFPIQAYLYICNYYFAHGLYVDSIKHEVKGYGGAINWNKTIKKSNKYISDGNIIFDPFILNEHNKQSNFITESMKHVLKDGYLNFGRLFKVGVPFSEESSVVDNLDVDAIIKLLRNELQGVFKDNQKVLILSLIEYFEWHATKETRMIFITNNFDQAWENLVENILNNHLIELLQLEGSIEEINDVELSRINFKSQVNQKVKRSYSNSNLGKFNVYYDHLGANENTVVLMDSKYYFEKSGLDYKQFAYNYFLLENSYFNKKKIIINGLVLPTTKESYSKIMLDWRQSPNKFHRNVYIIEFYCNVKTALKLYITEY